MSDQEELQIKTLLNIIIKLTNSKVITQYNNQSFSDIPLRKVNYLKLKSHFKNFKFKEITRWGDLPVILV